MTNECGASLQDLSDCGINPFAVQLFWESWARHEVSPRRPIVFPFRDAVISITTREAYLAAGWRPIATAPRDGSEFLAYAAPGQHGLPELFSVCSWHPDAGFCICELREATHWTPLPKPPTEAK